MKKLFEPDIVLFYVDATLLIMLCTTAATF